MPTEPAISPSASPAFVPLERLHVARPVDRIPFVREQCRGLAVLDLGAMDETAYQLKRGRGTWLHEEIAGVASRVVGLDSSALVPPEGLPTGVSSAIHRADISRLGEWLDVSGFAPDIVVAGELIEHLEHPLGFLRSIRAIGRLQGKTLILTTPNATALHNCLIGLTSRESTHHDHLGIFSYKTLHTLCDRAGFESWVIVPYVARFTEMKLRNAGFRRALIRGAEKVINMTEWLCPMMSFGYLVKVRI